MQFGDLFKGLEEAKKGLEKGLEEAKQGLTPLEEGVKGLRTKPQDDGETVEEAESRARRAEELKKANDAEQVCPSALR